VIGSGSEPVSVLRFLPACQAGFRDALRHLLKGSAKAALRMAMVQDILFGIFFNFRSTKDATACAEEGSIPWPLPGKTGLAT
jgi:hypothetical protein